MTRPNQSAIALAVLLIGCHRRVHPSAQQDTGTSPSVLTSSTPADDGRDPNNPSLPGIDVGFVDKRGGWDWSDKCWVHLKAGRWGWAKAECDEAMKLQPASPQPRASLLYNEGLIAKQAGDVSGARALFDQSLALRENGEVRRALEALGR